MEEERFVAMVLTPLTNKFATDLVNCNFVKNIELLKELNSRKMVENCVKAVENCLATPKTCKVYEFHLCSFILMTSKFGKKITNLSSRAHRQKNAENHSFWKSELLKRDRYGVTLIQNHKNILTKTS